jgi:hypothetical protein
MPGIAPIAALSCIHWQFDRGSVTVAMTIQIMRPTTMTIRRLFGVGGGISIRTGYFSCGDKYLHGRLGFVPEIDGGLRSHLLFHNLPRSNEIVQLDGEPVVRLNPLKENFNESTLRDIKPQALRRSAWPSIRGRGALRSQASCLTEEEKTAILSLRGQLCVGVRGRAWRSRNRTDT